MKTRLPARALAATVAVGAIVAALPAAPAAAQRTTITVSGSTSVAPLAAQLARRYVSETNGRVGFRILQGGSDVGVSDVSRGRVTLGMSARDPKPGDPGGLQFNRIARDAICLITNRSNRLGNISQRQVQRIFSGSVRNWSQVPGATTDGTIDLFVRTPASGTQDAFQNIFLGDALEVSPVATQRASNGLVQQAVRNTSGGIGYVSLAFTSGANAVRYEGVACTLRNAKAGTYGGLRNFWMVSRGRPSSAAAKFIKWIRRDRDAIRITSTEWVPLG